MGQSSSGLSDLIPSPSSFPGHSNLNCEISLALQPCAASLPKDRTAHSALASQGSSRNYKVSVWPTTFEPDSFRAQMWQTLEFCGPRAVHLTPPSVQLLILFMLPSCLLSHLCKWLWVFLLLCSPHMIIFWAAPFSWTLYPLIWNQFRSSLL